jgi:hypothetical protein
VHFFHHYLGLFMVGISLIKNTIYFNEVTLPFRLALVHKCPRQEYNEAKQFPR